VTDFSIFKSTLVKTVKGPRFQKGMQLHAIFRDYTPIHSKNNIGRYELIKNLVP